MYFDRLSYEFQIQYLIDRRKICHGVHYLHQTLAYNKPPFDNWSACIAHLLNSTQRASMDAGVKHLNVYNYLVTTVPGEPKKIPPYDFC